MSASIRTAFRRDVVSLRTSSLVPKRQFDALDRQDPKYLQIAASLKIVGLIEPLVVFPLGQARYRILDGNKRFDILLEQEVQEVECLLATDDESYTYNRRVNYLSTIGEHQMIVRALAHNSIDRIAEALNVSPDTIKRKFSLLEGVCKEAIDLLRDRRVAPKAFRALRKMKPVRQIESAELMIASNTYSGKFAEALAAGTREEMLIAPRRNRAAAMAPTERLRLENETDSLLSNLKGVEERYGAEVLTLSVSCRYVAKLLANATVHRYIAKQHAEICRELADLASSPITSAKRAL